LAVKTIKTFGTDGTLQTLLAREAWLAVKAGWAAETLWTGRTLLTLILNKFLMQHA
jgi:hypothetical protein